MPRPLRPDRPVSLRHGHCRAKVQPYRAGSCHRSEKLSESFIGSRFFGRPYGTTTIGGVEAVLPSIMRRAWITGKAEYILDPTDPFPTGVTL